MKSFILIPFLLIAFTRSVTGQSQYLSAKDSDPEAIALLNKAAAAFNQKNVQVGFKFKISYPGEDPVTNDGILYQSGTSYNLQLNDYTIISDGKTRWVYLKSRNEVNIYNESNGQDWISPQDFLQLQKSQDLVFVSAGTRSDGIAIVEAKPLKGRFEDYSKFTIGIKNNSLYSITALSSDGMRQDMTISSVTHPATFDAQKLFTFRKEAYPGVFVEDLRLD